MFQNMLDLTDEREELVNKVEDLARANEKLNKEMAAKLEQIDELKDRIYTL